MGSVIDSMAIFGAKLLECTNVSDSEALDRYVAGLKQGARDWVLIHDPSSLHKAARWAKRYNNTYYCKVPHVKCLPECRCEMNGPIMYYIFSHTKESYPIFKEQLGHFRCSEVVFPRPAGY